MELPAATSSERLLTPRLIGACVLVVVLFDLLLRLMGREYLSDSGFGLWTGAWSTNTSQWIADPYSTSHVLHGILFYWLLLPLAGWLTAQMRFVAAMLIEMGWELLENSPLIIDRYRAATASLEYYGDSILNSTCDVFCALLGFWLAWRFGWKWMLAVIIVVELSMLVLVRDNLTLNILMLVYPSESIKQWQMGV